MAENEIRIPITIELNAEGQFKQELRNEVQNQKSSNSSFGQILSVNFLIDSSKKVLSATGNTQVSKAIGDTIKYTTLIARASVGDITAMASLAIDLAGEAIKKVNELKAEAQINNNAKYNQIRMGVMYVGSNYSVSKDWVGNNTYTVR